MLKQLKDYKKGCHLFKIKLKKNSITEVYVTTVYKKYLKKTFKFSWRASKTSRTKMLIKLRNWCFLFFVFETEIFV